MTVFIAGPPLSAQRLRRASFDDLGWGCPDWADMCKHVAALLYGVGTRLDAKPELLFTLRSVNHHELIAHAASAVGESTAGMASDGETIADAEVSAIFGIEMDQASATPAQPAPTPEAPVSPTPARQPVKRSKPIKKPKPAKKKPGKTPAKSRARRTQ